jgi:hypothetical protein
MNKLEQVVSKLETAVLTLKKSNCIFAVNSLEYMGHVIDDKDRTLQTQMSKQSKKLLNQLM